MNHSRQLLVLASSTALSMASAQIITDGSMGRVESFNGKLLTIDDSFGRTVGPNLFHSFQHFNIAPGQFVTFTGGDQITRVISRVTGGEVSKIEGTLRSSIPGADFYLLNPAGILFGNSAKVDVGGAFVATTADGLTMADGTKFQARLGGEDVLTVAPPAAFGFLAADNSGSDAGAVRLDGSELTVNSAKGFDVVSRSIDIGQESVLKVPEGSLRMVAVGSSGDLPVESLDSSGFKQLGVISIHGNSLIDVGGEGIGRMVVRAQDMSVESSESGFFEKPTIFVQNAGASDLGDSEIDLSGKLILKGANIEFETADELSRAKLSIRAAEVEIDNGSIVSSAIGMSNGPDVEINAHSVVLTNGGSIEATSTENPVETPGASGSILIQGDSFDLKSGNVVSNNGGTGSGGDVTIHVKQFRMGGLYEPADISVGPSLLSDAAIPGHGGDVVITADDFTMSQSSSIDTLPFDFGSSGCISITADAVLIEGGSVLDTASLYGGASGSVTIDATTVLVRDGSLISTSTFEDGNSGHILIKAEAVRIDNGASLTTSTSDSGDSGFVEIKATTLELLGRASISTSSSGRSNAGDITLHAEGDLMISDSIIDSAASWIGSSHSLGGTIRITAGQRIDILGNSSVSADSSGLSKAGDVYIKANFIRFGDSDDPYTGPYISSGTDGFAQSGPKSQGGEAGNIELIAHEIEMNHAFVVSDTSSSGDGGDVTLTAGLLVMRDTQVRSSSDNAGRSGNVKICCGRVELLEGSYVTTESWGVADGGNVRVDASELLITQGSTITTSSLDNGLTGGKAGSIVVNADTVRITDFGNIDASSSGPVRGGDIDIKTGSLLVQSPSQGRFQSSSIITTTDGTGVGGNIRVTAHSVELDGPFVEVSAESLAVDSGAGAAGSVNITGGRVRVMNGAKVSSESFASNAGSLSIMGTERFEADAAQFVVTAESGNAGLITLASEGLLLIKDTGVEAVAKLDGGNIQMTGLAVGLSNARILANAEAGNGGEIQITTDLYLNRGLNLIEFDTQNQSARPGSFRLNTTLDLVGGLEALNGEMTTEAMEVRDGCSRRNPRANSLMVRGKGGIPSSAAGLFPTVFLLTP